VAILFIVLKNFVFIIYKSHVTKLLIVGSVFDIRIVLSSRLIMILSVLLHYSRTF